MKKENITKHIHTYIHIYTYIHTLSRIYEKGIYYWAYTYIHTYIVLEGLPRGVSSESESPSDPYQLEGDQSRLQLLLSELRRSSVELHDVWMYMYVCIRPFCVQDLKFMYAHTHPLYVCMYVCMYYMSIIQRIIMDGYRDLLLADNFLYMMKKVRAPLVHYEVYVWSVCM